MRLALGLLLLLPACGGAPFTEGFLSSSSGPGDDAGLAATDAESEAAPEASPEASLDASDGGAIDSGSPPDSPPDSSGDSSPDGRACTPITAATLSCGSTLVSLPSEFALNMYNSTADGGYRGCSAEVTPFACRCAETFDCACLLRTADLPTLCQNPAATIQNVQCGGAAGQPTLICP